MSPRPPLPLLIAIAALVLSPAHPEAAPTSDAKEVNRQTAPLRNEDIVRLVMTGTPEKAILDLIDDRLVDFDLCTEIIAELRTAGVSDAMIRAMRRRQSAMPTSPRTPQ